MTQQLPPERRYALYTLELTDPTVRISATCFGSGCSSSTEFTLCNPREEQYNDSLCHWLSINLFIFLFQFQLVFNSFILLIFYLLHLFLFFIAGVCERFVISCSKQNTFLLE